jgi:hypothetical protein
MFTFIKKLFGFDQETMKAAGVQTEQAPYKVEQPIPAHDVVPQPVIVEGAGIVETVAVPQTTNVVTEKPAPTKPARKPRAPKAAPAEQTAVKKAAPVKKAAAMKAAPKKPRSKKA